MSAPVSVPATPAAVPVAARAIVARAEAALTDAALTEAMVLPEDPLLADGRLAACRLTEEPPSEEELCGLAPDPDADPPAGEDAWLADLPSVVVMAVADAQAAAEAGPADEFFQGGCSGSGEPGAGFAAGGPADGLVPGTVLAGLTARAAARPDRLNDNELTGLTRAWRRLTSWATAGELAAAAELAARRDRQVASGADPHLAEHVADELAAALTLTGRGADLLVDFAVRLAGLPATAAALRNGDIDRARAWVIADETTGLDPAHVAAVEAAVIGRAAGQTTGQLRAAAGRAVLAADPAAAARRRERAQQEARVEKWDERSGTAALAGRDLPPAEVLAADARLTALSRELKAAGAAGGMDALRARVYTALLAGLPLATLRDRLLAGPGDHSEPAAASPATGSRAGETTPAASADRQAGPAAPDGRSSPGAPGDPDALGAPGAPGTPSSPVTSSPVTSSPVTSSPVTSSPVTSGPVTSAGRPAAPGDPVTGVGDPAAGWAASTGSVNLTMPLSTWLGGAAPGEAAGFGPVPAADARALALLTAGRPRARWCLTLTGSDGRALGHGCARLRATSAGGQAAGSGGQLGVGRHDHAAGHRDLHSPARKPRLPASAHSRARDRGPAAPLLISRLPAPSHRMRPGPYGAARPGRADLRMQLRAALPPTPQSQTSPWLAAGSASARHPHLDPPARPPLPGHSRLLPRRRPRTVAGALRAPARSRGTPGPGP